MRWRIRLAKSIRQELLWRPRQGRRSAANHLSRVFPIDTRRGTRAKARKLDEEPDVLRSSRSAGDRHCLPKNIEERSWPGRAPHRQFRLNPVAENANLLYAI